MDFAYRLPSAVSRSALRVRAHIDGAARGNPGPAGAGVFIEAEDDRPAEELFESLGKTTNNVAEYRALLLALRRAKEMGADAVEILSDSLLLVQQVNGVFKVKAPHLIPIVSDAVRQAKSFRRFSIRHVPREQNKKADRLANLGADASERRDRAT
jgi:ribonuclease HI